MKKGRPPKNPAQTVKPSMGEMGHSGLKSSSGRIQEELLKDLSGTAGMKLLAEMRDNDPIVGAFLFAVEQLMRQVDWKVLPADTGDAAAVDNAAFVDSCRDDMTVPWSDVITEILSMLVFGWCLLEEVYKVRNGPQKDPAKHSKFVDGLIGWQKLAPRAQDSLDSWIPAPDKRGFIGMRQRTQELGTVEIPFTKALLFRTKSFKENPEGRSILRNAYRPWYFKKRIEETEGIGIERDLAGLPTLTAPEGLDLWNTDDPRMVTMRGLAEDLIRNIRRDEQEGLLLPFGWVFTLASTGGARAVNTTDVINRYDQRIAMTVLADFILLGHGGKFGSFALAKSKTSAFTMSVVGYLNAIRDVFNTVAIPRLFGINGLPLESLPKLDYTPIEVPDLRELAVFLKTLMEGGIPINTPTIGRHLLTQAGIPSTDADVAGGGGAGTPDNPKGGAADAGSGPQTPATKPSAGGSGDANDPPTRTGA
jgi:hypothetical protein